MKKTVALLLITLGFVACDDGDLVFENLNFDDRDIEKCEDNELYFKIKDTELLLVDFSATTNGEPTSVLDTLAKLNEPQELLTNGQTKIYYRTYESPITKNVICALLAPANPKVTSEYTSIPGGTIKYTRTMTPVVTETSVNINHAYTINFENITLSNGTSDIRYTTLPYGTYIYESNKMSFNFGTNFNNCENVLTGNTSNEIVQLRLPEGFVFPTANQTQTINLSGDVLSYFVFKEPFSLDNDNPCAFPDKYKKEEWTTTSGSLQVETTAVKNAAGNLTGYKHVLKIVQAQFKKDNSSFVINERILGTYAPTE